MANGKTVFESTMCSICHQDQGDGTISIVGKQPKAVEAMLDQRGGTEGLAAYIEATMPTNNPANCVDDCADDVAAYLTTLIINTPVDPDVPQVSACNAQEPVTYGKRGIRLLTVSEYRNSIVDLGLASTGDITEADVSPDEKRTKSEYSIHTDSRVNGTRATAFNSTAEKVAAMAAPRLAQQCNSASACADSFLQLAYRIHRRPLTQQETTDYRAMFTDFGKDAGFETALVTALQSPAFLYRSELGVQVSEALTSGWSVGGGTGSSSSGGSNGSSSGGTSGYTPGAGGTTVNGNNFSNKSTGADHMDGTYNIWSDGNISHSFNFSNPSLVVIQAKGQHYDNQWPTMTVSVGGQQIGTATVQGTSLQTFTYLVQNRTGNQQLQISYSGDMGREPYGQVGNDKNLLIGDVTVAPAVMASTTPAPTPAPAVSGSAMELADRNAYVLDPYEYAASLAYMFTGTTPDMALLQAAQSGAINDPAEVERQVTRLLGTARGEEHVKNFAGTWFQTNRVTGVQRSDNARMTDAVKADMAREVQELFWYIFENDRPFGELLSADYTMLSQNLASFYGVNFNGQAWSPHTVPNRGGLLTTGAFHAYNAGPDQSGPIRRAVAVRELLLCQHVPPPPADLANMTGRAEALQAAADEYESGTLTSRQYFTLITQGGICEACHREIINPMFGVDDFDQFGLFRTSMTGLGPNGRPGQPIDNSGTLIGISSINGRETLMFEGSKDLGKQLATLDEINACLVTNVFRYTTGMPIEPYHQVNNEQLNNEQVEDFACAKEVLQSEMASNGNSPAAVFSKMGTLDLIRFRK